MKSIILIAPPAAGKGTEAAILKERYNIPHISTGDLLRKASTENTEEGLEIKDELEHGALVEDDIVVKLLRERILEDDCKDEAPDYLSHEYGHTIQSYILGPLYLLVIGLPSILWCGWISNWKCNQDKSYYWFYSEKWATYLGLKYLDPLLLKEV